MVVRATKPIKKGEQCTIIYGWNYINDDYEKRQAMLWSLYCFKCECVACHHKWPTYPGMNVKYLKDERDLLEPLDKISKCCSKPTREVDIEPLLSKCFELQSKSGPNKSKVSLKKRSSNALFVTDTFLMVPVQCLSVLSTF
ncbi:hypothetical protein NQ318_022141 [Aromia moschata]|uniref:SET domain-containing protein n=1 Tax=Aromia moschata TaxID=1265417 RepID=A0AAV8Z7R5_9CUCU|nr:hypothetical protein NQ318_022141 [Aromia moschata]